MVVMLENQFSLSLVMNSELKLIIRIMPLTVFD